MKVADFFFEAIPAVRYIFCCIGIAQKDATAIRARQLNFKTNSLQLNLPINLLV
jgi:hypothetical protein